MTQQFFGKQHQFCKKKYRYWKEDGYQQQYQSALILTINSIQGKGMNMLLRLFVYKSQTSPTALDMHCTHPCMHTNTSACMRTHMHACVCTCMSVCACAQVCACMHVHECACACTHTRICAWSCEQAHTHAHTCMRTHSHAHAHIHIT